MNQFLEGEASMLCAHKSLSKASFCIENNSNGFVHFQVQQSDYHVVTFENKTQK
jgi:hypothetical protein